MLYIHSQLVSNTKRFSLPFTTPSILRRNTANLLLSLSIACEQAHSKMLPKHPSRIMNHPRELRNGFTTPSQTLVSSAKIKYLLPPPVFLKLATDRPSTWRGSCMFNRAGKTTGTCLWKHNCRPADSPSSEIISQRSITLSSQPLKRYLQIKYRKPSFAPNIMKRSTQCPVKLSAPTQSNFP